MAAAVRWSAGQEHHVPIVVRGTSSSFIIRKTAISPFQHRSGMRKNGHTLPPPVSARRRLSSPSLALCLLTAAVEPRIDHFARRNGLLRRRGQCQANERIANGVSQASVGITLGWYRSNAGSRFVLAGELLRLPNAIDASPQQASLFGTRIVSDRIKIRRAQIASPLHVAALWIDNDRRRNDDDPHADETDRKRVADYEALAETPTPRSTTHARPRPATAISRIISRKRIGAANRAGLNDDAERLTKRLDIAEQVCSQPVPTFSGTPASPRLRGQLILTT